MALASPAPSSSSLSRMTRDRSGDWDNASTASSSHTRRFSTKPKRLQSAYLDENRGEWRCRNCGWTYPIPNPGNRERREHKKHCQGTLKVRHWLGGGMSEDYGDLVDAETEQQYDASRVAATPEGTDTAAERPILKNDNDDGGKTRPDSHGVEGQSKTDDFDGTVDLDVRDPGMLDSKSIPEADTSLVESAEAADAPQGLSSHDTPLGDEIQKESNSKEVQDVKPEGYGEQIQSGQQGIAAGGEKLEVDKEERDSKNVPEEEFKPPVDDHARMQSSPERKESDIRPSHGADQDRTGHRDPSAVESSKVVAASKDSEVKNVQPVDNVNKLQEEKQAGSGTLDEKGIESGGGLLVASQAELEHQSGEHSLKVGAQNEERAPSLTEDTAPENKPEAVRSAKQRELSLAADHKGLQEKAEAVEEVEEREPGLIAADDALRQEAQVLDDGKPCIPPDDNSPKDKVSSVDEGFAPKEQDVAAGHDDALKEKTEVQNEDEEGEPTRPADDDAQMVRIEGGEGIDKREPSCTVPDEDAPKENAEKVGQINDDEPSLTPDEKEKLGEEVAIERSEPALTKDDQDVDNRLGSVPRPFTTDGTENKSAEGQQYLQLPKGGIKNKVSQGVSDEGELKSMPERGGGNDEGEPSHMADEADKREEAVDVEGTEPNVTEDDREEKDHVKESVPRAVATDGGEENRSEEAQERLQITGGTKDKRKAERAGRSDEGDKPEEAVEDEGTKPKFTDDDQDERDHVKESVPRAVATDGGEENRSEEAQESLQIAGASEDEASQAVSGEGELERKAERAARRDEGEPSHMANKTDKPEEAVEVEGTKPKFTEDDQDERDHLKESAPRAVATVGTENRSDEAQESLQIARGTDDEASQAVSGEGKLERKAERAGGIDEGEPSHMANKTDKPAEAVQVEGTKPKFTEDDQDGRDHLKESAPRAVATDGVECRSGEEQQSLLGQIGNEGSEDVPLQGQSDKFEHGSEEGGDLHGQEITRIADTVSKPKDVATGQTSRGVVNLFAALRNWDDWDFLLSDEDISSKGSKPPLLEKGDRQISHGQDHLKKSKEKQPEVPEDDRWELIDPEEGRDAEQVSSTILRAQLDTGKKRRVAVKLSVAETNWDDWEDVINGGLMLIQFVKPSATKNTESAESALGDREPSPSQLDDLKSGNESVPVQVKTGHQTDTAAPGLTLHILEGDGKDGDSAAKVEDPEPELFEVLKLEEGSSNQEQGEKLHSANIMSQPESGQTSRNPPKLFLAERNWEDWEDVVRESGGMSHQGKTDPVLELDLGFVEHHTGLESPRCLDVDTVEADGIVGGYEALRSAHGDHFWIANNPGKEAEYPNYEKSCEATATSVAQGKRGQGGKPKLSETGGTGANWKDVTRIEYVYHGNGLPSPSVQEAQDGDKKNTEDGGLLSQHEFVSAQSAALKTWADIDDPPRSEYVLFDEPVGGSLFFRSVSLDGPDVSKLPSLRRRAGRKPPRFRESDRKRLPSQKPGLKGVSQRRSIVESDYAAGSSSGGVKGVSRHIPALPRSKSQPPDSTGNKPSLLTRQEGSAELQEEDITSKLRDHYWHGHHHWHEHSLSSAPVVQHDVVRLLRKQTKYNLICPICGSLITRQIILRKKKRRFVREKRARFRRSFEIIPVALDDDESQISRSGTSSDIEDEQWHGGCIACVRYFFCA